MVFQKTILKLKLKYKNRFASKTMQEDLSFYLKLIEAKLLLDIPAGPLCLLKTRMPATTISKLLLQVYELLQHAQNTTVLTPATGIPEEPVALRHFLEIGNLTENELHEKIDKLKSLLNLLLIQNARILHSENSTDNHNSRYLMRYLTSLTSGVKDLHGYYDNVNRYQVKT